MTVPRRWSGNPDTTSLSAVRQFIRDNLIVRGPGSICPCCCVEQVVLRPRKVDGPAARILLELLRYYTNPGEPEWQPYHERHEESYWVHIPDFMATHSAAGLRNCVASRGYSRMKYWDLIRVQENEDEGEHPGWYRMTQRGLLFARGEIRIPRWAFVYRDHAFAFSDGANETEREFVNITQALGDDFQYSEIIPPGFPVQDLQTIHNIGARRLWHIRRRRRPPPDSGDTE